ncbi:saccharopine dehydrogenase [Taibaiella sp. KBW10]|uniref:saccharopine dehydrogenase C-terminal domain-containing protein n=1 Tax=Taibaiella sp. KBW10 TaxID=2153357 RepID=UPI000F5B05EA|nr:saccharopine dehydrogenase C-terminal domain-containing protein [Taibaiella sp. KBW10]RQO31085.1 saccharopine dehydrogenase [Taibaiella sp. KBW10]
MKTILVAGAGKSSTYLIDYLLKNARQEWKVVVMDASAEAIAEKLNNHPKGIAAVIDVTNNAQREALVQNADIVLSILPPSLHYLLAQDCLKYKKNLITSSYVSPEIKAMDAAVKEAGLLFMCEMGLDPGIDHMSAMQIIHSIQKIAGEIKSFKSFCGGLVAPESDDNPWHYKISWNPRNIVMAGKAGAEWLENGKIQKLEYADLYANNKKVKVEGVGSLSYYPNRDSLKYLDLYDINDIGTFVRATLRHPAFSKAWNYIVKMDLTNEEDSFDTSGKTYADWIAFKTGVANDEHLRMTVAEKYVIEDKVLKALEWLDLFDAKKLIRRQGTYSAADILQDILEEKWKLGVMDKDMVVMQHQVAYERKGVPVHLTSNLVVKGENRLFSAMAKTVGLPMAILAKRMIQDGLPSRNLTGVHIPVMPEVYVPVLKELKKCGVEFMDIVG